MMAHIARLSSSIRSAPAALQRATGRGEYGWRNTTTSRRGAIRTVQSQRIAAEAAVQESCVEFHGGVAPVTESQKSNRLDRKEAIKNAKPFSDFLTDTFNRQHDYLRISVTERCNLRCLYCMPEEGVPLSPNASMLTTSEIFYLSSLFVSQGVTKIRLTGGEPTVRRDIVPLMHQIGSLRPKGLRELALTTNGISLHRKLDAMVEAGLTGVNLSLDTLDPFQFQIMTRRNGFDAVMRSIDRILEMNKLGAGIKLKVNCVVMRGLNEREIIPFVEMGREKDIEVRFIEYMPFGGNKWSEGKMIGFQEMLDMIRVKYPGLRAVPGYKNDTSKTYEVPGFVGKVGFITSMTNNFCSSCNRLRITSDGNLKVCLHGMAEVSLRDLLRQGNNGEPIDQEALERIRQLEMDLHEGRLSEKTPLGWGQRERDLLNLIGTAVKRKEEKHADLNELAKLENRPMILIDRNIPTVGIFPGLQLPPTRVSNTSFSISWRSKASRVTAPFAPLYAPTTQISSSIRAFTTSSTSLPTLEQNQNTPTTSSSSGAGHAETIDLLDALKLEDNTKTQLTKGLKKIRKKFQLQGSEYNEYWALTVKAQLADDQQKESVHAKAAAILSEIQLRNGTPDSISQLNGSAHETLMQRAQKYADHYSQLAEGNRLSKSRQDAVKGQEAVKGLVTELRTPQSHSTLMKEIEQRIKELEDRIAAETARAFADADALSGLGTDTMPGIRFNNAKHEREAKANQKKALSRDRFIQEHMPDLEQSAPKIRLLNVFARSFYELEDHFAEAGSSCSAQDVAAWQSLKLSVLEKVKEAFQMEHNAKWFLIQERKRMYELLMRVKSVAVETAGGDQSAETSEATPHEATPDEATLNELQAVVSEKQRVETGESRTEIAVEQPVEPTTGQAFEAPIAPPDESIPEQREEIAELRKTLQSYKKNLAAVKKALVESAVEQKQKMQSVMQKKQEAHAKRQELLKQLEAQEKETQEARMAKWPRKKLLGIRTDLDDILDEAIAKNQSLGEIDRVDDSDSLFVPEEPIPLVGFDAEPELLRDAVVNSPLAPSEQKFNNSNTLTRAPTRLISPLLPASSPQLPTSQPSRSTQTRKSDHFFSSDRKPIDALHLHIPASNTIFIDAELTVDFSAPVPTLQTQVYEMQQRLKSSYPRIDSLPYEVWTSQNMRTLQTWLKILISRWQTRFDDLSQISNERREVDERVKIMLDQMVRDHDLSNEAAERMAIHWYDIISHRGDMDSEAGGVLDWDEVDAGGLGFLVMDERQAQGNTEIYGDDTEESPVQKKPISFGVTKSEHGVFDQVSRRAYSTSSRPPRDTAALPSITIETPEAKSATPFSITPAQPSASRVAHLPHLTSTGAAHMVSISGKPSTLRTAIATGTVYFSNPTPLALMRGAAVMKGDVLGVSRIAGIMAAKKCPDIVPLCHPISLTHVSVELGLLGSSQDRMNTPHNKSDGRFGGVAIEAKVECTGPTGVEMEALTAVMGAALSVVDMCKAVDKAQRVQDVRVVRKEGGRSGVWAEEGWKSACST